MALVEVRVSGLAIDDRNKTPVVLLQEASGDRVLPIWIGPAEASAIAMGLAGRKAPRPLTHDLLSTVINGLGAEVVRVDITELQDNTFFARIFLKRQSELFSIDARPSDSIALAIRAASPIYASEELIRATASEMSPDEQAKSLRKFLHDLDLEDFGKSSL